MRKRSAACSRNSRSPCIEDWLALYEVRTSPHVASVVRDATAFFLIKNGLHARAHIDPLFALWLASEHPELLQRRKERCRKPIQRQSRRKARSDHDGDHRHHIQHLLVHHACHTSLLLALVHEHLGLPVLRKSGKHRERYAPYGQIKEAERGLVQGPRVRDARIEQIEVHAVQSLDEYLVDSNQDRELDQEGQTRGERIYLLSLVECHHFASELLPIILVLLLQFLDLRLYFLQGFLRDDGTTVQGVE